MSLNGVPAAANMWLLTDVLRKDWGFKGFVVSDASSATALVPQGLARDEPEAAARALDAGLDIEMVPPGSQGIMANIPQVLASGRLATKQVDDAVRRVIEAKLRIGLLQRPYVDEQAAAKVLNDPAHREAARVAAERSAVLLRNEGQIHPAQPEGGAQHRRNGLIQDWRAICRALRGSAVTHAY